MIENFYYEHHKQTIKEVEKYKKNNEEIIINSRNLPHHEEMKYLYDLTKDIGFKIDCLLVEIEKEIEYSEEKDKFLNADKVISLTGKKSNLWDNLVKSLDNYNIYFKNNSAKLNPMLNEQRDGFITDPSFLKKALFSLLTAYHSLYFLEFELQRELNSILKNMFV